MELRIISIFAIFTSSIIGSVGSYILSHSQTFKDTVLKSMINLFSAGVILSLSLVHITNEVIIELNKYFDFPIGSCCILFGLLSMSIFDNMSHSWNINKIDNDIETPLNDMIENGCCDNSCVQHCHLDEQHDHTCITNLNSKTLGNVVVELNKKKQVSVYLFEFACVFHSFLIGLSLGVTNNDPSTKTLTIALCFHQFLEGVSLGIVVGESNMKLVKSIFITLGYSITTPLAIMIGYVLDTYNTISTDNNKIKTIATCSFQGFAGGMLLYIALFQLIAEEFSKESLQKNKSIMCKLSLYISLLLGATSMCIMGVWI
jgi:solute carrier family 39 (zinc transporter), member 1/2/3